MHIRPAESGDVVTLAALAGQLGYPSTPGEVAARLRFLGAHPDLHAAFVAEADGIIVGWVHVFISARLESDAFAEIGGLVVDDRQRGTGVGKALIQRAEAWSEARGMLRLRVRSNLIREQAHTVYERVGFERIKEQVVLQKESSR